MFGNKQKELFITFNDSSTLMQFKLFFKDLILKLCSNCNVLNLKNTIYKFIILYYKLLVFMGRAYIDRYLFIILELT